MISGRLRGEPGRRLGALCAAVAAALVLYRFALDPLLAGTLHLPLPGRVGMVLLLLAPVATLMGMPFPTALASLADDPSGLAIRGWVANGYFSVLGSCLAIIASISFGFQAVLMTGAAIYLLGAAAAGVHARPTEPAAASA